MDDIYKNIEKYNSNKKRKILIVFDDMITDMLSNKKFNPIVTELFIRRRRLNISPAFIIQSYFPVPKSITLNSSNYFIMKIPNKWELQQVAFNHSLDIDFKGFMNLYKKGTAKPYSFLVIDATLSSFQKESFRTNIKNNHDNWWKDRDEKLQCDINREAAKISALSSGKIDKY